MPEKIALLGPAGTFSEEAARIASPDKEKIFCNTITDVFDSLDERSADVGIVPVENSLEGSVSTTLELLLSKDVSICREIVLDIEHCLLVLPNTDIKGITEVVSHPHALAQCRDFLKSLRAVKTRNFPSTAEAAREVAAKKMKNTGAIASRLAAELYGLKVLQDNVQDQKKNQTRFFLISKKCPHSSGAQKTSIILGLKDRPGALHEMLGYFADESVNLTKIESRPTRKTLGDYVFYIDFLGSAQDRKIQKILEKIAGRTSFFKILGSYTTG